MTRGFVELLSGARSNFKLAKSDAAALGYRTVGVSLAPAQTSGRNVCGASTPECRKHCINTAGRGGLDSVQAVRIARTDYFFDQREAFRMELHTDLYKARELAQRDGLTLAARLNVFSDIPWERVFPELFSTFHDVVFYDYTKRLERRALPPNYHLTYSRSECNEAAVVELLAEGQNVAVVFKGAFPRRWNGYRVINGDAHDLRFLDPRGVVVGLSVKGPKRGNVRGGFVVTAV